MTRNQKAMSAAMAGFSMLEILVTLVILALGLLGTAGLQAQAMRAAQGGQLRNHAVMLSVDIAERMEGNLAGAIAGRYAVDAGDTVAAARDCGQEACTEEELAAFDLAQWQANIAATLPDGNWQIDLVTPGNPATYRIVVSWVDRRTATEYETAGTGELMTYTTNKSLYR